MHSLRKNSGFVSGHDFSRAVKSHSYEGFSPWGIAFQSLRRNKRRVLHIPEFPVGSDGFRELHAAFLTEAAHTPVSPSHVQEIRRLDLEMWDTTTRHQQSPTLTHSSGESDLPAGVSGESNTAPAPIPSSTPSKKRGSGKLPCQSRVAVATSSRLRSSAIASSRLAGASTTRSRVASAAPQ